MSLVIAMKAQGRIVMAGDSCAHSGSLRAANTPKVISPRPGWLLGHVGGLDDLFYYLRDLPEDVLSPEWNIGRISAFSAMRNGEKFSSQLLWAHESQFYLVNEDGSIWEEEGWAAIGSGAPIAYYLLWKEYSPSLSLDAAEALARKIIDEAALVDIYVQGPAVVLRT